MSERNWPGAWSNIFFESYCECEESNWSGVSEESNWSSSSSTSRSSVDEKCRGKTG